MSVFTKEQAQQIKRAALQHVGAVEVDQANPGAFAWALQALSVVLSFVSLFTGRVVSPEEFRRDWSQTFWRAVILGSRYADDPDGLVTVIAHECTHVQQWTRLAWRGNLEDGINAPMAYAYLFSREARARLEAEAYATGLEIGVRLFGWQRPQCVAYIDHVRDVALPVYGIGDGDRELVAEILDGHAFALLTGVPATSELGRLVIEQAKALGITVHA